MGASSVTQLYMLHFNLVPVLKRKACKVDYSHDIHNWPEKKVTT